MHSHKQVTHIPTLFLFNILLSTTLSIGLAANAAERNQNPKAFAIRYWDREIPNSLPKPSFLLSKASPLSATDEAKFRYLAAANTLSTRLPEFCSAAHLLCFPEVKPSLAKHPKDADFALYNDAQNFTSYGTSQPGGLDSFKNYSNDFRRYSHDSAGHNDSFANYADDTNVVDQSFHKYEKGMSAKDRFGSPPVTFKGYAKGADHVGSPPVTFKDYGVDSSSSSSVTVSGSLVKKWVQPGRFFREKMLRQGTVMPMPDIKDKMPQRSFLPRSILTKLPFSSSKLNELKSVFRVPDYSSMDKMIVDSLSECERAPSRGETKRCVGSLEDMIDFATFVLGRNVTVRSTENLNGSNKNVMVGRVKGVNGGKVTQSVSCHQSLFPYLLYYCHSVPKVRVYEADLLDPESKAKINHGVAICHLDTTAWSPTHGAFLALGSGPGQIEVCHWIFENDMTWTTAD